MAYLRGAALLAPGGVGLLTPGRAINSWRGRLIRAGPIIDSFRINNNRLIYQTVDGSLWAPLHGSIKSLKGCYYTQERQSQERQDFRGRFDFAFQSALERARAALSTRLLL